MYLVGKAVLRHKILWIVSARRGGIGFGPDGRLIEEFSGNVTAEALAGAIGGLPRMK